MIRRFKLGAASALLAALLLAPAPAAAQSAEEGRVSLEWLGHMFFRLTAPNGTVVMTSPLLESNPDVPIALEDISRADVLLVPNSHSDDLGNPIEISARTGARVVLPRGLAGWQVESGLAPSALLAAQIGDTLDLNGVRIHVVWNDHDNTIRATGVDGGPAHGYIMRFENGVTVYFAASSVWHEDMARYAEVHRPHIALVHARSVVEVARTLGANSPDLHTIIPIHLRAGDPLVPDLAAQVEALGLRVRLFHPDIAVPYSY